MRRRRASGIQEASTSTPSALAACRLLPHRWRTLAAITLVSVAPAPGAQAPGGDARPLVTAVDLRGVASVPMDALRAGLATRATSCRSPLYLPLCWISRSPVFVERRYLDPLEFRRDVLRIRLFYWQRGWRDATVAARTERTDGGVRVIFDVDEREPTTIDAIRILQTRSVLPQAAVDRAMQLRAGDPLDLIAADSTILLLREELWERGYAAADVRLDTSGVSAVSNRGPVDIHVEPGRLVTVAGIEIAGNDKVSEEAVRKLLSFGPGDLFRRSKILESQRTLYLSGLFSELELDATAVGDTQRVVRLRVVEADLSRLELAGGLTSADFIQLQSEFTRYDFLGSARRLTIRGTLSNVLAAALSGQGIFQDAVQGADGAERNAFLAPTWAASVELFQPWLFSPRNQLGLSVFGHRQAIPGIVIDRGIGATAALTRTFGSRTNATFGYTIEASRLEASDVYFCVSFGVCLAPTIAALSARHVLAPAGFVAQVDLTNDPFAPDRGYRTRLDLEHASAWTASDFRYNRIDAVASSYWSMGRDAVLAGRIRVGWVGALRTTADALGVIGSAGTLIVHPRKRFYAGGSQSVRGFGERQLGPRVLTIAPEALTDTALASPCSAAEVANLTCDPNRDGLDAAAFQPQPLGGNALLEGSIEYRFPLWRAQGISGAVFVDGALIGTNQFGDLLGAAGSMSPGFGIRMETPVGPVRLDLGIRPTLVEDLPVITQVTDDNGAVKLVTLNEKRRYDPLDTKGGFLRGVVSRLRLHLAIGPAF